MPREGQKPPRRNPQSTKSKAKRSANRSKVKVDPKTAPKGVRLSAAKQALRDQLMVQRVAEGWTWAMIAAESGISPGGAKLAVDRRLRDQPLGIDDDPVKVIETVFQGIQLSVGSFEALASAAIASEHYGAATSAMKGANDAREKIMMILQATGRLPQEMGALRHLMDVRSVAIRMLDTMEEFDREMTLALGLGTSEAQRLAAREAAEKVRTTFAQLLGLEEGPEPEGPRPDDLVAEVRELPERAS